MDLLKAIASDTASRGKHAFGYAWIDPYGALRHYKQRGNIREHLGLLEMLAHARMIVGHCRYATHGDPRENINNHPFICDGGFVVHNGVIYNAEELVRDQDLWPISECDSEVLVLLYEAMGRHGGIAKRMGRSIDMLSAGPLAAMGLWNTRRGNRLAVARRGHPLHRGDIESGVYFASLEAALPGKVVSMADNRVSVFRQKLKSKEVIRSEKYSVQGNPARSSQIRGGLYEDDPGTSRRGRSGGGQAGNGKDGSNPVGASTILGRHDRQGYTVEPIQRGLQWD